MPDCSKKFFTAGVCGFCQGVSSAVQKFEEARRRYNQVVYVLHELVHNNYVTFMMQKNGAVFADDINNIPDGSVVMIGAHGVSGKVKEEMQRRFTVIDATCPRVNVLQKVVSCLKPDQELIMLCKKNHPEARGVLDSASAKHIYPISCASDVAALPDLKNPFFISQTTVSGKLLEENRQALAKRFPNLKSSGSICDASLKRQNSVVNLAAYCQCILVVGSSHSSNASELVKAAELSGVKAWLVENGSAVLPEMISGAEAIGVTAGASTPDELIDDVKKRLVILGYQDGGVADV